jgi:hypothetical protein
MEIAVARMIMMMEKADQRERPAVQAMLCFERDERKQELQCLRAMNENATNALYKARTATPTAPNRAAL